jgi:hypothetical protein
VNDEQKQKLIELLEYLWRYGADSHPAVARELNELRDVLGLERVDLPLMSSVDMACIAVLGGVVCVTAIAPYIQGFRQQWKLRGDHQAGAREQCRRTSGEETADRRSHCSD